MAWSSMWIVAKRSSKRRTESFGIGLVTLEEEGWLKRMKEVRK